MVEVFKNPAESSQDSAHPMAQTDVVINRIRDQILSGELTPGSRLPIEKDLAESFAVSRGSLREAVRALCIMGVLETRQGDGTYVTSLDSNLLLAPLAFMIELQAPEHRQDIHVVRRILEAEAASRAALGMSEDVIAQAQSILESVALLANANPVVEHEQIMAADIAFHRLIAHSSGNSALAALIDALASRTTRTRLWLGLHVLNQTLRAHQEHLAILDAIRTRQPDRAKLEMSHHLIVLEDMIRDQPEIDAQ